MTKIPMGNHHAKAYEQNAGFSAQDFKRIQRKHPKAVAQAIEFNDQKAAFESGKLKALPEDTFIGGSKKGIKDKAKKAGEAIKGAFNSVVNAAKTHKVAAAIIGAVTVAAGAIGITAAVKHSQKSHQE